MSAAGISCDPGALLRYRAMVSEAAEEARRQAERAVREVDEFLATGPELASGIDPPLDSRTVLGEVDSTLDWIADVARTFQATQSAAFTLGLGPGGELPGWLAATARLAPALIGNPRRFALVAGPLLHDDRSRDALRAQLVAARHRLDGPAKPSLDRPASLDGADPVTAAAELVDRARVDQVRGRLIAIIRHLEGAEPGPIPDDPVTLIESLTITEQEALVDQLGVSRLTRLADRLDPEVGAELADALILGGSTRTLVALMRRRGGIDPDILAAQLTPDRRRQMADALAIPVAPSVGSVLAGDITRVVDTDALLAVVGTLVPRAQMELANQMTTDRRQRRGGIDAIIKILAGLEPEHRTTFLAGLGDIELDALAEAAIDYGIYGTVTSVGLTKLVEMLDTLAVDDPRARASLFSSVALTLADARSQHNPLITTLWDEDEVVEVRSRLSNLLLSTPEGGTIDAIWRRETRPGQAFAAYLEGVLEQPDAETTVTALLAHAYGAAEVGSTSAFSAGLAPSDPPETEPYYPVAARLGTILGALKVAYERIGPADRDDLYLIAGLVGKALGLFLSPLASAAVGAAITITTHLSEQQRDAVIRDMRSKHRSALEAFQSVAVPRDADGNKLAGRAADAFAIQFGAVQYSN